ncbi:hypothetical protein LCGC14_2285860, partial [marine sediment metagenome]
MNATKQTKTGKLKATSLPGSDEYYMCGDCDTLYPVLVEYDEDRNAIYAIKCNGHIIGIAGPGGIGFRPDGVLHGLCPWCRPDSQPWK